MLPLTNAYEIEYQPVLGFVLQSVGDTFSDIVPFELLVPIIPSQGILLEDIVVKRRMTQPT